MGTKPGVAGRATAGADRHDSSGADALRHRDAAGVAALVDAHAGPMLRLAHTFVRDRQAAEEVVQETWLAALEGIHGFEGRSSLRTWLFAILVNKARTRASRERRVLPFAALARREAEVEEPAVEPERFVAAGEAWAGHWTSRVPRPADVPDEQLLAHELREVVAEAIAELPPAQRTVISLRDVEGWPAEEVCNALGLTETNQRVLLHRARSRVRRVLERYLAETTP